jgi:hypothetical protein
MSDKYKQTNNCVYGIKKKNIKDKHTELFMSQ